MSWVSQWGRDGVASFAPTVLWRASRTVSTTCRNFHVAIVVRAFPGVRCLSAAGACGTGGPRPSVCGP
mgnify:CR=1 FL=1